MYERTQDAVICYSADRAELIHLLQQFAYQNVEVPQSALELSGRQTNREYQEKLIQKVLMRYVNKVILPYPVRCTITAVKSLKYIKKALESLWNRKIEVALLDGVAIGVSVLRGDMNTAGSVMFLLDIGETLEEWTHKKSVDDLARSMSLNITKVWLEVDGTEVLVDTNTVKAGDQVIVHMGNVIPFDGIVVRGTGMVNQSSLTGESVPVEKKENGYVYAGTVLAVICILDPIREEAAEVISRLREAGFTKLVMMTGDSERTAAAVAEKIGVDEYYSEVLPEDKAAFVDKEQALGRKVIMIGDGVNDSPALSAADVGIAISDGAQIAREVADITVEADNLYELVALRTISRNLMRRIRRNYGQIVGINSGLILLGVLGVIQPTTSALLHNTSTLVISMRGMQGWKTDTPESGK